MNEPERIKILNAECYKVPDLMAGCLGCRFNDRSLYQFCYDADNRHGNGCTYDMSIYIEATPEALEAYNLRRVAKRMTA